MDDNTFKLLSLVLTTISALALGIVGLLTANANAHAQTAAMLAQQAVRVQEISAAAIQKTADATHALVNGAMAGQLGISADLALRVADLTQHPEDIAQAKAIQDRLSQHLSASLEPTPGPTLVTIADAQKPVPVDVVVHTPDEHR